ncbi:MAG: hypothetical protein WB495_12800 [Xanthobacteraceae bacterium]
MPLSIVYVLSNPVMPGLVKIGRTSSEEAVTRIAQLLFNWGAISIQIGIWIGMGIPIGSELKFTESEASAFVTTPKKVNLNGDEMSLTAATRSLLGLDYSVAPGPYWDIQWSVAEGYLQRNLSFNPALT